MSMGVSLPSVLSASSYSPFPSPSYIFPNVYRFLAPHSHFREGHSNAARKLQVRSGDLSQEDFPVIPDPLYLQVFPQESVMLPQGGSSTFSSGEWTLAARIPGAEAGRDWVRCHHSGLGYPFSSAQDGPPVSVQRTPGEGPLSGLPVATFSSCLHMAER